MIVGLIWQPFFSPVAIALAGVALAALTVWTWWRVRDERPIVATLSALMRLVAIAAIVVLLMGPSIMPPHVPSSIKPVLHMLVDTSASMQTVDMGGRSRAEFAAATWLSDEQIGRLRDEYRLSLSVFDESVRAAVADQFASPQKADEASDGDFTRLAEAVRTVAGADEPGQTLGLVVISDGRDSAQAAVEPVAAIARARSMPIHVVPLGGPTLQQDLSLIALPQQDYLLVDEQGRINVTMVQVGASSARSKLTWKRGDRVESRVVEFRGQESVSVEVPIQESRAGNYEYEFTVEPLDGEIETENNRALVFTKVTSGRFRVLLLEGEPYWDTKFLAQSLRGDDRVELVQISQINRNRQQRVLTRTDEGTVDPPTSLEELAEYDVIVLGRAVERVLDPATVALLPQYVSETGGRVIFARGPACDLTTAAGRRTGRDLAVLEPVIWGRGLIHSQPIDVEPYGLGHPCFASAAGDHTIDQIIGALPPLDVAPVVESTKAATRVLARLQARGRVGVTADDKGQPVIAVMPYGRGMVASIIGDGLWKWKLLSRRDERLAGVFDRFWSNMVRWMAMGSGFEPDRDLSLALSRRSLQVGHELAIDVLRRFAPDRPADLTVVITDPTGAEHRFKPRAAGDSATRLTTSFTPTTPGIHDVHLEGPQIPAEPVGATAQGDGSLSSRFFAFTIDMERVQCAADPTRLRRLAGLSGGTVLNPNEPGQLFRTLERHRAAALAPPQPRFVWDTFTVLVLTLGWAGLEWIMRKKGGLL